LVELGLVEQRYKAVSEARLGYGYSPNVGSPDPVERRARPARRSSVAGQGPVGFSTAATCAWPHPGAIAAAFRG
jgi:hypothetical protein